ncbi:MAG TPA: DUF2207 domain-containing protein, partial [Actinomycetota bacterium]|nr:DUF2207 domain-containing protein [Actinomycetota bacterium]
MERGGAGRAGIAGCLLALAVLLPACGAGKDYSFPDVRIDATILPDGSLDLVERRTFRFDGEFSVAFFSIEHPATLIQDFRVTRDGRPLPVTTVAATWERFEAEWPSPARDEDVTFTVAYRARCAVEVFGDAAHLLWQFVGRGWEKPTDRVLVTLRVPGRATEIPERPLLPCRLATDPPPDRRLETVPLARGDVRAWGHGPYSGEVAFVDPQTVTFEVRDLRPATFVEGSVLMPPEVVPLAYQLSLPARDRILREEAGLAAEANRLRARSARARTTAVALLLLLPLLVLGLVALSRRRDRVAGVPPYLEEPPDETHPAELAHAWATLEKANAGERAYRTQLLHLARQGTIEIAPIGRVTKPSDFTLRRRKEAAPGLDQEFMEFLFPDGQGSVRLKELTATGSRGAELKEWSKELASTATGKLAKVVASRTRVESWLLAGLAAAVAVWSVRSAGFGPADVVLSAAVGLLAGGLVRIVPALLRDPALALVWAVIAGVIGVPSLIPLWLALSEGGTLRPTLTHAAVALAFALWPLGLRFMREHLPPTLRRRIARWRAFRRYLKDFSSLPEAPTMAVTIWERYMVYAVALGVAAEVERQVRALVPAEELGSPFAGAPAGFDGTDAYRSFATTRIPSRAYAPLAAGSGS